MAATRRAVFRRRAQNPAYRPAPPTIQPPVSRLRPRAPKERREEVLGRWSRADVTPAIVVIVGVLYTGGGWPDTMSSARTYLHWYGVSYPTISDPGASLAKAFAIPGIPTTVIADASGHLRYRKLGPIGPGELQEAVAMV